MVRMLALLFRGVDVVAYGKIESFSHLPHWLSRHGCLMVKIAIHHGIN
jgi:hypothetical protein